MYLNINFKKASYKFFFIACISLNFLFFSMVNSLYAQDLLNWQPLKSLTEGWKLEYPKALFKYGGFVPDAPLEAKIKGHIYWNSGIPSFKTSPKNGALFSAGELRSNISYLVTNKLENNDRAIFSKFIRKGAVVNTYKHKEKKHLISGSTRNGNIFHDTIIFSNTKTFILKIEFPETLTPIMNVIVPRMRDSFKKYESPFLQCENKCIKSKKGCIPGKLYAWCTKHTEKCRISCYKKTRK